MPKISHFHCWVIAKLCPLLHLLWLPFRFYFQNDFLQNKFNGVTSTLCLKYCTSLCPKGWLLREGLHDLDQTPLATWAKAVHWHNTGLCPHCTCCLLYLNCPSLFMWWKLTHSLKLFASSLNSAMKIFNILVLSPTLIYFNVIIYVDKENNIVLPLFLLLKSGFYSWVSICSNLLVNVLVWNLPKTL